MVGGLDGHLILALPHNVGMCNLLKIRWVLSSAMASSIVRVYTVVLLSLPLSFVSLMSGFDTSVHEFSVLSIAVRGEGGVGESCKSSKSLRAMAAAHVSQQVTVKRQTALE